MSPFLYKSEIISIFYHKYGKSSIEIILLPAPYAMRIPWNNFFNLKSEFYINWLFLFLIFFSSVRKNCVFIFEKDFCLKETRSFV